MKPEKRCPISETHTRLHQAHDAWHEALAAYYDADEFCRRLNALIPCLRSVTFILQKELRHGAGFDAWYRPWQDRMRTDARMRWLVEARNQIEKQGDLATNSVAVVSVLVNHSSLPVASVEVPSLLTADDLLALTELKDVPDFMRADGVLRIERRWMLDVLPNEEILDSLAHCYGVLAELVIAAHERFDVRMRTFGGEAHYGRHHRSIHPSGKLPCMVISDEARVSNFHLAEGVLVRVGRIPFPITQDAMHRARDRYGLDALPPERSNDPIDIAIHFHEVGKLMLVRDGFHNQMAWIVSPNGLLFHQLQIDDQQAKGLMYEQLARDVQRHAATGLIAAGETWWAKAVPHDDPRFALRAGLRDDREEALFTDAITADGRMLHLFTTFTRVGDTIVLGDTQRLTDGVPFYLSPVTRVWEGWHADPPTGRSE